MRPDECRIAFDIPYVSDESREADADRINQALADRFEAARAGFTPSPGRPSSLSGEGQVAYDDGHLTAVTLSFDAYTGGPYPTPWLETVLYDSDQHREVKLEDLFTDRDKGLNDVAARVAAELWTQPNVDASFIANYVAGSAENLAAFQPTAEGLRFSLPAYRSGPYGAGMFDSEVPYADIRGTLDPRGPLWRQSAPFTFDGPDGAARKTCFERLVAAHRTVGAPTTFDAKDDPAAPAAARAFMAVYDAAKKAGEHLIRDVEHDRSVGRVYDAAKKAGEHLDDLTTQYIVLRDALARMGASSEAEKTFVFLDDHLCAGAFGSETRESVTTAFVSILHATGSAEEARRAILVARTKPAGTVEQGADSVVIGGIRVPRKT